MTYNAGAVSDTAIAFQKPITLQQGRALRDNPLAVFEGDPSAPASLLPTVHLGTITTTSGGSLSLTSLNLAPYKMLRAVWVGVSHNQVTAQSFTFAGVTVVASAANSDLVRGMIDVDLQNGNGFQVLTPGGAAGAAFGITNATTSITVAVSAGAFDAGSIRIYGMK